MHRLRTMRRNTSDSFPHFHTPKRLDFLLESLLMCLEEFGWRAQAWAVLNNHYHFIAVSPADPSTLRRMLGKLHMTTAKQVNAWDGRPGRKVWYQYWDSRITFQRSYLARLNYVHYNPARHAVIGNAENYRWCSASWFAACASSAFVRTVQNFRSDQLPDDC